MVISLAAIVARAGVQSKHGSASMGSGVSHLKESGQQA
jgi:hypothetical protein